MKKKNKFTSGAPGLKSNLMRIFEKAVGREFAIPKRKLLFMLGGWHFEKNDPNFERRVRAAIVELRNEGYLILSTAADGGGYWLAKDWAEVKEFTEREYHNKAISMLETEKIMKKSARDIWGPEQPRLF